MKNSLKLGEFEIFWLNGGEFELDGGTMFGAVPKVLWSKIYPFQKRGFIKLINAPLLIKTPEALVIIETGLGNKLTEKQKKIFRVSKEWDLPGDLKSLGIRREEIDYVILTHCDFDHASGAVMLNEDKKPQLTFPNAKHIVQEMEWQDALQPNRRSIHTYWPENFLLKDSEKLQLVDGNSAVCPGVKVIHTGGHTRGHQIVRLESQSDVAYHLADLLPTHAHFNPLWIMAYDNFPLEVVAAKEKLEAKAIKEKAWFTFYHDPYMYACKYDTEGHVMAQFEG